MGFLTVIGIYAGIGFLCFLVVFVLDIYTNSEECDNMGEMFWMMVGLWPILVIAAILFWSGEGISGFSKWAKAKIHGGKGA